MRKFQREDQSILLNQDASYSDSIEIHNRYKLKCSFLTWNETNKTLRLRNPRGKSWDYDFRTFFFPPSTGSQKSLSVATNNLYINTLLFQIDQSVANVREKSKNWTKAVSDPISIFMYVLTYFRNRGIYTLKEVHQDDMDNLARELAEKKWRLILNKENLWHQALADLESRDIPVHVLFQATKTGRIESLNKRFWEEKIGYSACDNYSYETKQRIFQYCETQGYLYAEQFKRWLAEETKESFYSQNVLRNIFKDINRLATKHEGIDYLQNIPFFNIIDLSRKYCERPDERTENIPLSDATYLLKRSLEIVFDHGPNFIGILKRINQQQFLIKSNSKDPQKNKTSCFKDFSSHHIKQFLKNEKPFDDLTNIMGLPAIRNWSPRENLSKRSITLVHLIALIQGACAIVIMFLNGRRKGEVLDESTGLRTTDLFQFDDELGIYQCNFYIEKTYQDRHPFYVNRSTATAIQLLTDMKDLLSELTEKTDCAHLFSICSPVPLKISRTLNNRSFDFPSSSNTLSIASLMRYLYPNGDEPNLKTHMSRRLFALLYHYRYDNSDLLSLSQHLRHFDILMTRTYITDPNFRDEAKKIASTIGKRKDVTLVDKELYDSLELEIRDLENEIEAAGRERLTDIITRIISGELSAGGFTRFIRKLFRRFAKDIEFSEYSSNEQGKIISERLQAQGYKPNPMPHGQCNAPKPRGALNAKCRDEKNQTNIERACASLCRDCQYHYNNEGFLQNLEDDAKQLKEDMENFRLLPMQQERAQDDYNNLIQIIELNKRTMEKNRQLMMKTRQELYE